MKRQGDLLIVEVARIPEGALPAANRVLAEGEATGHRHELTGGEVFEQDGRLFFRVTQGCEVILTHPEHHPVTFPPGDYEVIRQREYQPEGWRYVQD